jgi:hypothetical protein
VATGAFDEAIALCRRVIEALIQELGTTPGDEPLRELLESRSDERRTKEYLGVISRIKQLAAFAHHEMGTPLTYSRPEALFVVRVTEAILSLVEISVPPTLEPSHEMQ